MRLLCVELIMFTFIVFLIIILNVQLRFLNSNLSIIICFFTIIY